MLHTVISTQRSGSNVLCKYLSNKFNTVNLLEPVTDSRDESGVITVDVDQTIYNIIERSKKEDIVAKFHIEHLMEIYPSRVEAIIELLNCSERYYCIRRSLSDQILSIHGIKQTNACDERFKKMDFTITGKDATGIVMPIVFHLGIMGEWYKQFPGKLVVLEDMSDVYTAAGFAKYADVYTFSFDNEHTEKFVKCQITSQDYFNQGNKLFSLVGA
jgi:hypothetical protein